MATFFQNWQFDFYSSLPFWAALVAVAVLARLAGARTRLRGAVLVAASSALLLALPRFGPLQLGLVWAVAASSFGVGRLLGDPGRLEDPRARRIVETVGILAVLAFLAFFKYRFLQDAFRAPAGSTPPRVSGVIVLLGISYFSFKAIHVIVESGKRAIGRLDLLTFLGYFTFFPSFISGPINRYDQFAATFASDRTGKLRADLAAGGERIVHGLFKKVVLVTIVFPWILTSRIPSLSQATPIDAVVGLWAYALYFYFDFAGYSDLAIGAARVIGIELPENFNRPFLQKNIRDLWTNWHMSLTGWLVDYVYWPVVRKLRNLQAFRTRPVLLSVVGMNVTFLACGVWHGEALNFVVWGAYHGLGISAVNVYQRQKRRVKSPLLQRWFRSRASQIAGAVLTFNFFSFGLALFVLDLGRLGTLLSAVLHQVSP